MISGEKVEVQLLQLLDRGLHYILGNIFCVHIYMYYTYICVSVFTHTSRWQTSNEKKKSVKCKKIDTDDPRGLFQSCQMSDSVIGHKNINKKCIPHELFMQNQGSEFISIFTVLIWADYGKLHFLK